MKTVDCGASGLNERDLPSLEPEKEKKDEDEEKPAEAAAEDAEPKKE